NHALFLQAAARYKERFGTARDGRRVRVIIIEDGHLGDELEAQAREVGLNDDLIFTGTRNDPENFYPALDTVALTSRNEGTPLTLIEAMANARPVIATAVGGVVDLLGAAISGAQSEAYAICQRGISVPSDDPRAFAAALARMIGDSALRHEIGDRGLQFVEKNYSRERLLHDVRTLYRELLQPEAVALKGRSSKQSLESRV